MSQSGSMHSGTGGGSGKVSVQDLTFTHWVDKATPPLMQACTMGTHVKAALLTVRKAGKDALEYIKIKLDDVLITNVHTGGSAGEERLTENVTLNFRKFHYEYTEQTAEGGGSAQPMFGWDVSGNKEWT